MELEKPRDLSPQPSPQPSKFFGPVSLARAAVIFVVIHLQCMQRFILCIVEIESSVRQEQRDNEAGDSIAFFVTVFYIIIICFTAGGIWLSSSIPAIVAARDFRGVLVLLFVVCAWILIWTAFREGLFRDTMSDAAMLGLHSITYISIVAIIAVVLLGWRNHL